MTAGKNYYAEFYATIASRSGLAIPTLGIAFASSTAPFQTLGPAPIAPVVEGNVGTTLGWQLIAGSFTATGNEQALVVGYFGPGYSATGTAPFTTGPGVGQPATSSYDPSQHAYYFLDDVALFPVTEAGPSITTICNQTSLPLGTCALPASSTATYQWFPTTGLSNPAVANPTVTTSNTTTYTLTVRIGSKAYTSQTTVTVVPPPGGSCPCTHDYAHNTATATYKASLHNAGNQAFELGNDSPSLSTTTIDVSQAPYNGTIVFDGIYHVKHSIKFIKGNVVLRPGTVFYVDSHYDARVEACYLKPLVDAHYGTFIEVSEGSHLVMEGAEMHATCKAMWGGIILTNKGEIRTTAAPDGRRCVITDAWVGVMAGEYCEGNDTHYSVTATDFTNCRSGFVDLGKGNIAGGEGVTNCTFTANPTAFLEPFAVGSIGAYYSAAGLVLDGPNLAGVAFRGNTFHNLVFGAEVRGNGTVLENNTFSKCFDAAILVGGYHTSEAFDRRVTLRGNTIDVPTDFFSSNQINQNNPVAGIRSLDQDNRNLDIRSNTIDGGSATPASSPKTQLGIELHAFANTQVRDVNTLRRLDEGIRLQDASAQIPAEIYIVNNAVSQTPTGFSLRGDVNTYLDPVIRCNSITNTGLPTPNYGIRVEAGATTDNFGNSCFPSGNRMAGVSTSVFNDGTQPVDYWRYSNELIATIGGNQPVNLFPSPSPCYTCGQEEYYEGVQRTIQPTAAEIAAWMQRIRQRQGTPKELRDLERELIRYHQEATQLPALQTFVGTLPLLNTSAFHSLSLYLMTQYRRLDLEANAQTVRQQLLIYSGTDPEIANRVQYFDVLGRLSRSTQGLTPADSTLLTAVAQSGTGYADLACTTLHYFYPHSSCAGTAVRGASAALATKVTPRRLSASTFTLAPNPATDQVTVHYAVPTSIASLVLVINDLKGQRVLVRPLLTTTDQAQLEVNQLPTGLYAVSLLVEGRPLSTQKLTVLH